MDQCTFCQEYVFFCSGVGTTTTTTTPGADLCLANPAGWALALALVWHIDINEVSQMTAYILYMDVSAPLRSMYVRLANLLPKNRIIPGVLTSSGWQGLAEVRNR